MEVGRIANGHVPEWNKRFYFTLVLLLLVQILSSINAVVLASALPAITLALDALSSQAFWCGTGFLVARTVTTPIYGRLSEAFGRRDCLLSALGICLCGGALCGAAQNIEWLVAARVLQGIGDGGMNSLVQIILVDMVELRQRGRVMGVFAMSQSLGLPAGLILGGFITEHGSWRWVFFMSLPIGIIAFIGLFWCLKLAPPELSFREALKSLDWIGMSILTGSVVSLLIGMTTGGTLHPWNSVNTILPIISGGLGCILFITFEGFVAKTPFIPLRVFGNRTAASGFLGSYIHGFIFWASSYYLILYFLGALQHGILRSSIDLLPGIGTLVISSGSSGFLFAKFKRFQKLIWFAWVLVIIGSALMSTLGADSPPGAAYGFQVIAALGGGIILPGRMLAVQSSQKEDDLAIATSLVTFMLSLGQAFGVGIGGSTIQNCWKSLVEQHIVSKVLPSQYIISEKNLGSAWRLSNAFPPTIQAIYRQIYAKSINALYILLTGLAGGALLVSFFGEDLTLDRDARGRQRFIHPKEQSVMLASTVPVIGMIVVEQRDTEVEMNLIG